MNALLILIAIASAQPKRLNKAIELLEQGQPVYYTTSRGGYEEGKELARTWADYINYELEHGAFDVTKLREFMQGLVDGGPTASGHRTPAVVVSLPVLGLDEASMRANLWVVQQVLASGVHGVLLCHARSQEAVRVFRSETISLSIALRPEPHACDSRLPPTRHARLACHKPDPAPEGVPRARSPARCASSTCPSARRRFPTVPWRSTST